MLGLNAVEEATLLKFREPRPIDGIVEDFFQMSGVFTQADIVIHDRKNTITNMLKNTLWMFRKCDLIIPQLDGVNWLLSNVVFSILNYVPEKVLESIHDLDELAGLRINKIENCYGMILLLLSNDKVAKLESRIEDYEDSSTELRLNRKISVRDMITLGLLPESVWAEENAHNQKVSELTYKIQRYREFAKLNDEFT